jgi:hypothetical protein
VRANIKVNAVLTLPKAGPPLPLGLGLGLGLVDSAAKLCRRCRGSDKKRASWRV